MWVIDERTGQEVLFLLFVLSTHDLPIKRDWLFQKLINLYYLMYAIFNKMLAKVIVACKHPKHTVKIFTIK